MTGRLRPNPLIVPRGTAPRTQPSEFPPRSAEHPSVSHWDAALRAVAESPEGVHGPRSFATYLDEQGLDPGQYRAAALSVDTRSEVPDSLADRETMVLHLGRATDGPGAQFALVRVPGGLSDFFLDEMAYPADDRVSIDYTPDGDDAAALDGEVRDLLAVSRSLPTFSARGFVNLALSTGLLSRALGLDAARVGTPPMPVASTFEFAFEPHPDRPTTLRYADGYLELDTLVTARRDGERVLLVVTARCGARQSVGKHTIAYPALAAESLSLDVDRVVPVSLRARPTAEGVRYSIYECSLPTGAERPCLAGLDVVEDSHFAVRL